MYEPVNSVQLRLAKAILLVQTRQCTSSILATMLLSARRNLRNAKLIAGLSYSLFLRVNFVRACVPPPSIGGKA
jgi:hypothetical protein